ncbi:MAG TPA: hypothetical protein VMB81_00270 [Candidatus Sulfotelmatobacter sp.]|nr:hypothetical protein [Candidatus Sulfotelmatobacter sp.]
MNISSADRSRFAMPRGARLFAADGQCPGNDRLVRFTGITPDVADEIAADIGVSADEPPSGA